MPHKESLRIARGMRMDAFRRPLNLTHLWLLPKNVSCLPAFISVKLYSRPICRETQCRAFGFYVNDSKWLLDDIELLVRIAWFIVTVLTFGPLHDYMHQLIKGSNAFKSMLMERKEITQAKCMAWQRNYTQLGHNQIAYFKASLDKGTRGHKHRGRLRLCIWALLWL